MACHPFHSTVAAGIAVGRTCLQAAGAIARGRYQAATPGRAAEETLEPAAFRTTMVTFERVTPPSVFVGKLPARSTRREQ